MITYSPVIQKAVLPCYTKIDVLRLDLLHPVISGNKWFKLKNNLAEAIRQNKQTILTFGGANSNHLAAAAEACKLYGLKGIAVVRGDDAGKNNDTILQLQEAGMQIEWLDREQYRRKTEPAMIKKFQQKFGDFYMIPEGGNNAAGILGCTDIITDLPHYDFIFCACGSGATFAGLAACEKKETTLIGISVLAGENTLADSVEESLRRIFPSKDIKVNKAFREGKKEGHNFIINYYAFSGFAKHNSFLTDFKQVFEANNNMVLDYIYTNKLFFGINDMITKKLISKKAKILAIHSGGLQGNKAFEQRYGLGQLGGH